MRIGHLIAAISRAVPFSSAALVTAQAQNNTTPADAAIAVVDDQRLHAAKADGDWITFGRDYSNQRFVPFREINRDNAARLAPASGRA